MKNFTLHNSNLGSARQQQYYLRSIHDKEREPERAVKVKKQKEAKQKLYKERYQREIKQGKKHYKLLLKALADGEIENKWVDHVKVITSWVSNPFIKMTVRKWRTITRTYTAYRLAKQKEQKGIDEIMKILNK